MQVIHRLIVLSAFQLLLPFQPFLSEPVKAVLLQTQENFSEALSIAVLPFENLTRLSEDEWMGLSLAESLAGSLARLPTLQVIERSQIKRILQEQSFSQSALADSSQAPSLGKLVGARRMVLGNFQKVGERLRIQARMIAVETGQILPESVIQVEGQVRDILDLQDHLAQKLLKSFQGSTFSAPAVSHSASANEVHSLYYRGQYLLEKNTSADRQAAEKLFQEALRLAPQDALVQTGLAELSLARGVRSKNSQELEKAMHWINVALQNNPQLVKAWLVKVNILIAQKLDTQAEALLKEALEVFPGNTELVLSYINLRDQASIEISNRMISSAELKSLLQRLGAEQNAPEIAFSLGMHVLYELFEQDQPDFAEAFALLKQAGQALPDNPVIPLQLAQIYVRQNQPELARQQIELGLSIDPDSPWIPIMAHSNFKNLYSYYRRMKQPERMAEIQKRSLEVIQKTIQKYPDKALNHVLLAQDLEQMGQTEQALAALDQAERVSPEYPTIYTQRAKILEKQKKTKEAIQALDRGLAWIDRSEDYQSMRPYLMFEKGNLKMSMGQADEALLLFQAIYDRYPAERSSALIALIGYYTSSKEYSRLLNYYQELFQIDPFSRKNAYFQQEYKQVWLRNELLKTPHSVALLNDLGQVLLQAYEIEEAQKHFKTALELEPNNPVVLYNLGSLFLTNGEPGKAMPLLEKALKNKPAYVNAAYNLGLSYLALHQEAQAREIFQQLLSWQPDHAQALAALKNLH
ncbi:hypothetical protein COW36_05525 [bacterium (Candidatus Blackallbacteria) CG17_big_fil_post_rev_8_21_14_2_50_48_46]|uniref:Uncharacterized protein n=1 Tax=bacterium (Candidatus Blackallbacteria) CG17_big_fil_post_rev_8_21_14_2_50_48_46 TaxID=2014261 RepID=A0A2M7G876_9BACT|nr:MAG: hypothetical protein COW64_21120 [bacterium (Candidatus Blackallbacteria) CG18_big_fil_WC_8_21_14_2_50_49_26]PIW18228.1 MAG: hypothetical protein COW36_05525 [bacterium (Candidatus Blackallbacteria) CG17_big_fil_post_rev_8_21_14_2_50_48_46]PIW50659.1 MAG: hypothetical protein COW20_01790 [bacterium (Candidatus Blackallbacteria) CG13_big_fil_rev_8_21_14_2_50_49_14]